MKQNFWKKNWQYIVAFLCPMVIVLCHCIIRESWMFGEGSILGGDAGAQYIYVFYELWDKVHSHNMSLFTWNAQFGVDFYLNCLYYAMSPATLVILALPKSLLEDAVQFFMVFKWSLLSVSFVYYLMNTKLNKLTKQKPFVCLVLGLCFTIGDFFIYTFQFFNWYDSLIAFPILLILVEKMIENGSWKKYCLLLAYAMICNFYITFPMCLWLLIYYVFVAEGKEKKKYFRRFAGASVLSAIMSVFVILPEVLNVGERYTSNGSVKKYVTHLTMSIRDFVESFLGFELNEQLIRTNVDFFVSFGVLMIIGLYWGTKIDFKEKIKDTCILAFLIFSVLFGGMNYLWHGMSIPHGFNPRFGFVILLFMIILALKVFSHLEELKVKYTIVVAVLQLAIFLGIVFTKTSFDSEYAYLAELGLILFYGMIAILISKKSIQVKSFIYIVGCACFLEMIINAYILLENYNIKTLLAGSRLEHVEELVDPIETSFGERMIVSNASVNSGMKIGKPSVNGFLSYVNGDVTRLADVLGFTIIQDAGGYYTGAFPMVNKLLNIGYGVSAYDNAFYDVEKVAAVEDKNLFKMNGENGLGYVVDNDVINWELDQTSVFETQNNFVQYATGNKNDKLFEKFVPDNLIMKTAFGNVPNTEKANEGEFVFVFTPVYSEDAAIIYYEAEEDGDCFVNICTSDKTKMGVSINMVERDLDENKGTQHNFYLGDLKKGQSVRIIIGTIGNVNQPLAIKGQIAKINKDVWQNFEQELTQSVLEVNSVDNNSFEGKVNAKKDGMLFTSIPAFKGFDITVDGEKITPQTVANAFFAIPVTKGEHVIQFEYETPYAFLGGCISIAGLLVYVILCINGKRSKKNV